MSDALRFACGNGGIDGVRPGLQFFAGKAPEIANLLGLGWHIGFGQRCLIRAFGPEDRRNWQAISGGKVEIALVMRRAAKDRAGAIFHQHEIGDVDRQLPRFVKRVAHPHAGIKPAFLGLLERLFRGADPAALGHKTGNLRVMPLQVPGQRMVRADRGERRTQQGVGPRGVHLDPVKTLRRIDGRER